MNVSPSNTHLVGLAGVVIAIGGLLTQPAFSTALISFFPAPLAGDVSSAISLVGLALAYFGRPVTVAQGIVTKTVTETPTSPTTAVVQKESL